ncbi:hypothetical protein CRENBAI_000788, partial [Crenichthys baileyi]
EDGSGLTKNEGGGPRVRDQIKEKKTGTAPPSRKGKDEEPQISSFQALPGMASFCLSRYAPPLRCPVRHAGYGNDTFPLGRIILLVTSELRRHQRLLSCACEKV